jgi:hypothetical protein
MPIQQLHLQNLCDRHLDSQAQLQTQLSRTSWIHTQDQLRVLRLRQLCRFLTCSVYKQAKDDYSPIQNHPRIRKLRELSSWILRPG